MPGHQHADLNQIPVIVMIKDEGNGDPAKPQSQGGKGEQPDVAHLKQTTVKGQTDKQKNVFPPTNNIFFSCCSPQTNNC